MKNNMPWEEEPDREEFEYRGFKCLIKRVYHLGILCGYVGLPIEHPYYEKYIEDIPLEVHGGLTYANNHIPNEGKSDLYWIGFDCAHCDDIIPRMFEMEHPDDPLHELHRVYGSTYKTIDFVRNEIKSMVKQLEALNDPC